MFNKLKSFSEDVAKSFNDIQQGDPVRRNADSIRQLKNGLEILNKSTPESEELVQPEDEPARDSTQQGQEVSAIPIALSGPLKDIDLNQLPVLVRAKLKKFAKYEEKYPVLLDAFKTEKRKGELVVAFEKVLKECTPVSTISDAGLLVDYLTSLSEKASLLDAELRTRTSELTKEKQNHAELSKKLANADKTIRYAEEAADKAQIRENSLKEERDQLTEYMKKLESQITESNNELERVKAEVEKVHQSNVSSESVEHKDGETDITPQDDKVLANKKDLEEKTYTIQTLQAEKLRLEGELKALKESFDKIYKEKSDMFSEKEELIKKIEKIEHELTQKLEASMEENATLAKLIENSKHSLIEANEQMNKLIQEKSLVTPKIFESEKEGLNAQINEIAQAKEVLKGQLDTANKKILALSENISSIEALAKNELKLLEDVTQKQATSISELQCIIDNLKKRTENLNSQRDSLELKVKSLEDESAKSAEDLEKSKNEVEEAKLQIFSLESKIANLTGELTLKDANINSTTTTLSTQSSKSRDRRKKKKNGKSQTPDLSPTTLIDGEHKLNLLNERIHSLENEKKELINEKEMAIEEKERYFEEKEKLLKEKETILAEHESLLASVKAAEESSASNKQILFRVSPLEENDEAYAIEKKKFLNFNKDLINAEGSSEKEKQRPTNDTDLLEDEKRKLIEAKTLLEDDKSELLQAKRSLEEEKETLIREKNSMQDLIDKSLSDQTKIQTEKEELQRSIKDLEFSKKTLIEDLKSLQTEKESIQTSKNQLEKDLSEKKREIITKDEEIENLRDLLKAVGDDLVTAKDEIKEMKATSSAKFEEKIIELQSLIGDLEKQVTDKEEEKLKLKTMVRQLEEETNRSKESLERTKKELKELHAKVSSTSSELQAAKKEVASLKTEKEKLNKRVDELLKFQSADSSLKLEIASMQSSISHKDEQIRELKDTMERKNKERDELNNTISTLKATNTDLVNSNKSLVSEKSALINKHEMAVERTNSLNSELSKLQISRQKVVTELDALKLQHAGLLNSKSKSSNDVQTYKQQCEELSMKVKDAQVKIDNLEDDLFEAGNMLQERTRESSTIRKLLIDAEEQTNIKTADLKGEIRSIMEEKNEVEAQLHAALKKKQRESEEFKALADRHAYKIQELETTVKSLNEKYKPLLKVDVVSPEAQQKQKDLEELVAELRVSLNDASKKIKDFENLNSILKKLNEETSLKFERLSKNYKQITQQYRKMQEQNSKLESPSRISEEAPRPSSATSVPYLKNVLVGFLEHREQREQLLPVIKTLFELNEDDERKLLSALK